MNIFWTCEQILWKPKSLNFPNIFRKLNIFGVCEHFYEAWTIFESWEQIWKRGLFFEARTFFEPWEQILTRRTILKNAEQIWKSENFMRTWTKNWNLVTTIFLNRREQNLKTRTNNGNTNFFLNLQTIFAKPEHNFS